MSQAGFQDQAPSSTYVCPERTTPIVCQSETILPQISSSNSIPMDNCSLGNNYHSQTRPNIKNEEDPLNTPQVIGSVQDRPPEPNLDSKYSPELLLEVIIEGFIFDFFLAAM